MSRKRLCGLDVLRLMSVLVIFLFHSNGHLHCSYGVLNAFVSMGAVFMTAFFMLSGYVIAYKSYSYTGGGDSILQTENREYHSCLLD